MFRILLVEDDVAISNMVNGYLINDGFLVKTAYDGQTALDMFYSEDFDLILLDLMIPKIDGMEVMKIIREKSSIPILITSAKDSDLDKALGLGFGADDYISKPFSMIELSARIKANIRRATKYSTTEMKLETKENNLITIQDLIVDLDNFSATKDKEKLKLTSKEFEILKLFVTNLNRVFTKSQIYSLIWNDEYYGDENVINVHIRRLREKIEDDPSNPKYIKTLWGIGYKMEALK